MASENGVQLTKEGRTRLLEELESLKTDKLPSLKARIQDENEHGDISDNSEYEDVKEELVHMSARIEELEDLLENAREVEPAPTGIIGLGSSVTIESDSGETETWQLVSHEEADSRHGTISTESPVGHAIVGRKAGDSTEVETPAGPMTFTILSVS